MWWEGVLAPPWGRAALSLTFFGMGDESRPSEEMARGA